jgi:hypothetical protein
MKHITHLATHIENALQQILQHDADTLTRETGFVQRQRKLTGSTFAQMMVFGAASNPCPTYTDWTHAATCAGTPLTPQAIEQRFTPQAAHFLYALLQRFAERVITLCTPEVAPLLQRFAGVFIKDSTVISLPKALATLWQGAGGSTGATAAVKVQVRWNFGTGQLDGPTLQPARCHDRTTPYGIDDLPAGSLELADLGYLCLEELQAKQALGQYFVYRYKVGTAVFTEAGEPLDLLRWLAQVETVGECRVWLGAQARVPVRVVAFRLSEASVNRARRRLREFARKKGRQPTQERVALTQWLVVVTNVPEALLSAQEVGVLARVRWQVEILFRVWKSCFRIDECRSRNVWRVLCEWYAKLMGVVLWHWLLWVWRGGVWDRSLHKAARAFQRLSVVLAVCWRCGWGLGVLLELFEACSTGIGGRIHAHIHGRAAQRVARPVEAVVGCRALHGRQNRDNITFEAPPQAVAARAPFPQHGDEVRVVVGLHRGCRGLAYFQRSQHCCANRRDNQPFQHFASRDALCAHSATSSTPVILLCSVCGAPETSKRYHSYSAGGLTTTRNQPRALPTICPDWLHCQPLALPPRTV